MFTFDAHSFGKSEPLKPAYMRSYVQSPHHLVDDVYTYVQVSCRLTSHSCLQQRQQSCILHLLHLSGVGMSPTHQHRSTSSARECMHAAGSGPEVPGHSPWPAYVDGRRLDGGHGGNPDSHSQAGDLGGMRQSHSCSICMLDHSAQESGCFRHPRCRPSLGTRQGSCCCMVRGACMVCCLCLLTEGAWCEVLAAAGDPSALAGH